MNKSKVDFDEFTDNYNSLLRDSTGFFTESEAYFARYKVDILRREVSSNAKRVLEYGCGIGRNIPFLRAAFPEAKITGTDISNASLDIARQENPGVEFFTEYSESSILGLYDVIFIAGVFHHIPPVERARVMKMLYQRLAPGGTILIFEHNPYNPVTRKIVNDCPYDKDAVLLKPSNLKNILVNAGFSVSNYSYCLFVPPSFSLLLPLETKLGWLPLGGQYWVKANHAR
ncbi:class I SAM-dependent methyltransferase [Polynucleobacter sp. AP-Sanab-80-C2]|uniref:class I SAM-dependent methyltransferase n=1 Tax=Polynucleobacter sp. AP-Sanab-80-C2 TaxID=3108274 RepID=UPI002B228E5B|nr:class I SAM-dependent methyltransferase [Polynucleobacter sp. AP-Sanab-80-C2]MEA9598525.1 class I SAM-dependent methyltransferase [Polynucleobacter sp. AP-Sanab-80-C2]